MWACVMVAGALVQAQVPATESGDKPAAKVEMTPGDYLDSVGQKMKARWRQLYREAPPTPSVERLRVAFALGGLMADSYLAVQAGDAQQFRNNNQEVLKFCGVLGLVDKISPDVMAGSKLAESEDWPALRKHVSQTQQHIESLLNEQRDEDLTVLVGLGLWIRLFDITTSMAVVDTELRDKTICIGSMPLLNELVARHERLTEASRTNESVALIGNVLDQLQRHWTAAAGHPTQEVVRMTHDKLKFVIGKLGAK
jgi:hypothetical protein